MEYIKVIALFLFIIFLVLQIWFGQKAKVIAYFFFTISASLYIMDFNWSLAVRFITVVIVLLIVLGSLYFEFKSKSTEDENDINRKQQTFADKNRRK